MADSEEIASLKTDVRLLRADVLEMKGDVKSLLVSNAERAGQSKLFTKVAPWVAIIVSAVALWRS